MIVYLTVGTTFNLLNYKYFDLKLSLLCTVYKKKTYTLFNDHSIQEKRGSASNTSDLYNLKSVLMVLNFDF